MSGLGAHQVRRVWWHASGSDRFAARFLALIGCLLAAAAWPAAAQQYESEVRELEDSPVNQQKKLSEAELIKSVEDNPYALALTLRELAGQAIREGRNQQAAAYMERAIKQNALAAPVQQQMQETLGKLYVSSGDHREIVKRLGSKAKRKDASAQLKLAVGAAYAQLGQCRTALPLVRDGLRKQSRKGDVSNEGLQVYAVCLLETGNYNRAAPILERLVRADPGNKEGWIRLAAVQVKRKDFDRATAVLELAHRQGFLTSPDERRQLIRLFMKAGAPYEAGALLQGWIDSGAMDDSAANLRLLAQAWSSARESARAIRALEKLVSYDNDGGLYLQLGRLQAEQGEWRAAEAALSRALQAGGADVPKDKTLVALGLARYQQADIEGALRAFQQASNYSGTRAAARQWVNYLASGRARQQALEQTAQAVADFESGGGSRFAGMQRVLVARAAGSDRQPGTLEPGGATPVGADASGNAAGTIPPYRGGIRALDVPLKKVRGRPQNPFASEQPRLVIDRSNYTQHAGKLTAGQQELFRRYNQYQMRVYPTHRTVKFDERIEQASQANIKRAKLLESDSITGARLGFPFVEPSTGAQVMWNHRLRPRGKTLDIYSNEIVIGTGVRDLLPRQESLLHRYGDLNDPADLAEENMLLYYVTFLNNVPAVGRAIAIVHETADQTRDSRRIWVGAGPGGRTRRIPPVGYDFPRFGAEGMAFVDQIDMYNGSFERYVWKMLGRREIYVPYNAYDISSPEVEYQELFGEKYPNPEHARYELHRVWAVEAVERAPAKHTIGKRVFYLDEDSWEILLVDVYDRADRLWQLQEAHMYFDWEHQVTLSSPLVHHDFKKDAYYLHRLTNETTGFKINDADYKDSDFFPRNATRKFR